MRAQISVIQFDQAQWQAIRFLLAWVFSTHKDLPIASLRQLVGQEFDGSLSHLRYFVRRQLRSDGYMMIEDARTLLVVTKEVVMHIDECSSEVELALSLLGSEIDSYEASDDSDHGGSSPQKQRHQA